VRASTLLGVLGVLGSRGLQRRQLTLVKAQGNWSKAAANSRAAPGVNWPKKCQFLVTLVKGEFLESLGRSMEQDKGGQLYEVTEVYRAGAWIDVGIWRALELVAPQVGEPFNCTLALLGYRCSKIKTGMIKWHMFLIRYKMVIISREGKLTLLWEKVELE